jgi:hypothetical protein
MIHPKTGERYENPVTKIFESDQGVESSGQILIVSKDGTERTVFHNAALIRNRSGGASGVILIFRDIMESG